MPDRQPVETKNLDRYGYEELPWSRPRELLDSAPSADLTYFLGTSRPDGRLHAAGIGAQWLDGDLYFTAGPGTRRARNLAADPIATISVRHQGIDLVFEGEATRITDPAVVERAAARFREGGWPAETKGDEFTGPFSAPSAGPPPWHLYRFMFHTVFGVATAEPYGATRWRFKR
jgi:pyridoxamine 5'-phosphate oxidase-like protein